MMIGLLGSPRARATGAGGPNILGQVGERAREAIPALSALKDDPDPAVRSQAGQALGRMGREGLKASLPFVLETLRGAIPTRAAYRPCQHLADSSGAPTRRRPSRRWSICSRPPTGTCASQAAGAAPGPARRPTRSPPIPAAWSACCKSPRCPSVDRPSARWPVWAATGRRPRRTRHPRGDTSRRTSRVLRLPRQFQWLRQFPPDEMKPAVPVLLDLLGDADRRTCASRPRRA